MNLLWFLATPPDLGMKVDFPVIGAVEISPIMAGLFTAAFWTTLAISRRGFCPLKPQYGILAGYAIGATLANAAFIRFREASITPVVAFATALFAGTALAIYLCAAVGRHFAPLHQPPRPVGAWTIMGLPLLLIPLSPLALYRPAGAILLVSSISGFVLVSFLVNAGMLTITSLRSGPLLAFCAALLTALEYAVITWMLWSRPVVRPMGEWPALINF